MATQAVINELTAVIQTCLTEKMQQGFDASANLTIEIARELAVAVEAKSTEYTDTEILKVKDLISGDVDLTPFTEFMTLIKTMLDGDEDTEGFQIFNTLVSDTVVNKQAIISHTSSITLITETLATIQATLTNHEQRIATLEAIDHRGGGVDCESCQDDMLEIVKGAISAGCVASTAAISAYQSAAAATATTSFANELDPIVFTSVVQPNSAGKLTVSGTYTGRRPVSVTITFVDGTTSIGALITDDKTFTATSIALAAALEGTITLQGRDAGGTNVGNVSTTSWSNPEVQNDGGGGDGAVL